MSAAAIAKLDATVKQTWAPDVSDVPALYVGIVDPKLGSVVRAYGTAAPGRAATTEDSFRIGSISKSFTATVVLGLIAKDKLSLTETISHAAPAVASRFPTVAELTIDQLLSMKSGIPDFVNSTRGIVSELVADPQRVFTPDELIRTGIGLGLKPPGTPGYSSTNFVLLQEIAQELTGKPLADLIKGSTTDPLKMEHTYLPPDSDTALPKPAADSVMTPVCQQDFAASGGKVALGTNVTAWNASYGQGAGGMTSTISDLRTWAASKSGTTLLPKPLAQKRLQFAPIGEGENYGLGIFQVDDWVGHEGEALGWEAIALYDAKTGVSVAFAANTCGVGALFALVIKALYPDSITLPGGAK
jgi:D-alanyl-D-alanine carboxypeptidase